MWWPHAERIKPYLCCFRSSSCLQMSKYQEPFLKGSSCNENSEFGLGLNRQCLENIPLHLNPVISFYSQCCPWMCTDFGGMGCECLMSGFLRDLKDIEGQGRQRWSLQGLMQPFSTFICVERTQPTPKQRNQKSNPNHCMLLVYFQNLNHL